MFERRSGFESSPMGSIGSIGNTTIESKQAYYKFRDRHAKLTWQFSPLGNYFLFAEQTKRAAIRHPEWPYPRMPDWLRYSSRVAISKYVHACVFPVFNHRCVLSLVLFLKNRTFFILLLNIICGTVFNIQNNWNVFHSPLPVYIVSNL